MNPLQQASVRRKAYYLAAILGLFTVSMLWRGMIPVPLSAAAGPARWLAQHTILDQSQRMELRELDEGDPEIAGSAVRLGLVGSRGLVVTYLWTTAIEKQKRNDFHEFEVLVRAVTKLQPHFITPWIFQSWNIAYNVSVEMHSLNDMYFYISRGIELLAEGERRNKRSPDMRYQIAFYYQNKFGVADQAQTLRCLFQLSCIPPGERDPVNLEDPNDPDGVNRAAFLEFCKKYPHLVRRLRGEERAERDRKVGGSESLRCRTPRDVVRFLRDNKKVPSRYKNATDLADADKQFPVVPPKFNEAPDEAHPGKVLVENGQDDFSAFLTARAWFAYALQLVPPPAQFPEEEGGGPRPAATPRPGPPGTTNPDEYDPFKYRVPRLPMLILFRQGVPRAQTYQAEMEEKDGWFDASGWEVDEGVDLSNAWFVERATDKDGRETSRRKQKVVVGAGVEWARQAWGKAAELWRRHGQENALELPLSRLESLKAVAWPDNNLPPEPSPELLADPEFRKKYEATRALVFYAQNRNVTNFAYYMASAEAESQPETIQARKTLWQADQLRRVGNKQEAIRRYEQGLDQWKQVLLRHPNFHKSERFERTEEETYEFELDYLRLVAQDDPRVWAKAQEQYAQAVRAVVPFLPAVPEIPPSSRQDMYLATAERFFSVFAGPMPTDLPPGDPRAGQPWISNNARESVLNRLGLSRQPSGPPAMTPGGMTPAPPMPVRPGGG